MINKISIIGGDLRIVKLVQMLSEDGIEINTFALEKAESLSLSASWILSFKSILLRIVFEELRKFAIRISFDLFEIFMNIHFAVAHFDNKTCYI